MTGIDRGPVETPFRHLPARIQATLQDRRRPGQAFKPTKALPLKPTFSVVLLPLNGNRFLHIPNSTHTPFTSFTAEGVSLRNSTSHRHIPQYYGPHYYVIRRNTSCGKMAPCVIDGSTACNSVVCQRR